VTYGPNVKKLIIRWASKTAVPKGGGVKDAILFMANPAEINRVMNESARAVEILIDLVRTAAAPNPWADATDEDIAQEILAQIDTRTKVKS
jgi:hypothetical protein